MSFVGKKYKLDKSENFDEYMKELGVGLVTRKMGNSLSPTVEVTLEGDTYTLTTTSTFKTSAISFKLGVEFDEETLDGRNVKSIITLDGNKLTQEQKGDKPTTIVREFIDNELITTLTIGSVKCVRVYKAV
ncbi:fatty acid-binding protein, muscle [Drosophila sechellia]|uniref:Fatty acid-binding protein, muscle n=1 Tax=Drosophila sechellia TaxID=7238 RepID=B4HI13_DROSE|nr:fatty acid-binding protein, muscle [Drosophila sechellia]EDW42595.1 GM26093 [Drosophila sechellia]